MLLLLLGSLIHFLFSFFNFLRKTTYKHIIALIRVLKKEMVTHSTQEERSQ